MYTYNFLILSDTENQFYDLTIFYVGILALQLQKRSLTSGLVRLNEKF